MTRGIAILLATFSLIGAAHAQPATTQAIDQSSPKALLRSFYLSHGEVDEATIRSVLHATTPLEQQIVDSVVQIELAHARLRAVERTKFGSASTRPTMTRRAITPDTAEELDALTEKVDGDNATVTAADPSASLQLVRIDGKWKLPIASLVGPIDPAMAQTLTATTRAQIEIIDALSAEVASGKLASVEQVRQELARRFAERLAAATRSSTQPAAAPPPHPAPGT